MIHNHVNSYLVGQCHNEIIRRRTEYSNKFSLRLLVSPAFSCKFAFVFQHINHLFDGIRHADQALLRKSQFETN